MRIEVSHKWAVTAGSRPDRGPGYCPLTSQRHAAAVEEYRSLLRPLPDGAADYRTRLADMAVMIPAEQAVFWYRLTAVARTAWLPVDDAADPAGLLAAARDEFETPPRPRIHGDHPGTRPARSRRPASATSSRLWCVTTGADPDDESADAVTLDAPGLRTLDDARRLHLATAAQLADRPALAPPTENLVFWHALSVVVIGPWTPADAHADPAAILRSLRAAAAGDPA